MTDDGAISRSVLAEQVKDRLLRDILSGRYPAHSRIVETRVARELGTSQAPVREALRGLAALGVVEILPFQGARVRRPAKHELLEAYAVRAELETLAARLGVPGMTDADMAEIDALHDAMLGAAEGGDRHEVALADAAFHARLIRLAGNATLERVWHSLEPYSRTYITLVAPGADEHWTAGLHVGIVAALRTRDPAAVVTALEGHFEAARAHLAEGWLDPPAEPPGPAPRAGSRVQRHASRPGSRADSRRPPGARRSGQAQDRPDLLGDAGR